MCCIECKPPLEPLQQLAITCAADQLSVIWMTDNTVPLHELQISEAMKWNIYAALSEQQTLRGQHFFAATVITNMPP